MRFTHDPARRAIMAQSWAEKFKADIVLGGVAHVLTQEQMSPQDVRECIRQLENGHRLLVEAEHLRDKALEPKRKKRLTKRPTATIRKKEGR